MSTVLDKLGWIPQSKGSSTSHQIHTKSFSPLVRVSYQGIILCPYWSVLPSFLVNKIGGPHGLLDHVLLGKLNYGPMMCRRFELCLQSPYDENGITSQVRTFNISARCKLIFSSFNKLYVVKWSLCFNLTCQIDLKRFADPRQMGSMV